jgi:hypothetical protein
VRRFLGRHPTGTVTLLPRIADLRALPVPRGRGPLAGFLLPLLGRPESLRGRFLSVNQLARLPGS